MLKKTLCLVVCLNGLGCGDGTTANGSVDKIVVSNRAVQTSLSLCQVQAGAVTSRFLQNVQQASTMKNQAKESASLPVQNTSEKLPGPLFADGADPFVTYKDGFYYYTHTTGNNITIWKARSIRELPSGEKRVVWAPPPSGPMSKNIWAPEIHFLDGKWYVYFAADDGHNANHRMFVLEADDPMGPYREKGKITAPTERWAIDGTVLEMDDGQRYFVWSGWDGFANEQQNLYLAHMKNPWTLDSDRVQISTPSEPWEWEACTGVKVQEGPEILKKDGTLFLVYSADQSWTDNYKLAALRLKGRNPMDPASWEKLPFPLFASYDDGVNAVIAPGHCSFVKSADGKEDWILYHSAQSKGSGWRRQVRAQSFSWGPDGLPQFFLPSRNVVSAPEAGRTTAANAPTTNAPRP